MILRLLGIVVLVLLNGFFVAAEFALVRSRRPRLEALTRGGDTLARIALKATSNIPTVLSASQLGITLSSLALGWVTQSTLAYWLDGAFAGIPFALAASIRVAIAATVTLVTVTYVHVVFGELTPRALAINNPERMARLLAPPMLLFAWIVKPFNWLLQASARLILRVLRQPETKPDVTLHSSDELRLLVEQAQEGGSLHPGDAEMLDAVFEFSEKNAREVMTPRTEIIALPIDATLPEILGVVEESGVSRYPVYDESIDHVVGIVLAKDLLKVLIPLAQKGGAAGTNPGGEIPQNSHEFSLRALLRPVHVIPGSREVEDVLADFKRLKVHMAVVLDEYGGTAGIVTMEDLLEEIVGEILDEYDTPEDSDQPVRVTGGETVIAGSTNIGELNDRFSLSVPDADATTIGGYVFGVLGRLPVPGDRVNAGGAIFTVKEMDGRKIDTLAVDLHSLGDRRRKERAQQSADKAAATR